MRGGDHVDVIRSIADRERGRAFIEILYQGHHLRFLFRRHTAGYDDRAEARSVEEHILEAFLLHYFEQRVA